MPEMTLLEAAEIILNPHGYGTSERNAAECLAASYLRAIAAGEYKQVVRCGECEYWQNDGVHNYGMCQNPNIGSVKMETDFCSYGEKR